MKDMVSCFGEQTVQVADCSSSSSSSKAAHKAQSGLGISGFHTAILCHGSECGIGKMVSNVYSLSFYGCQLLVSVTWSTQGLFVAIGEQEKCSLESIHKSVWRKKKGCKRLEGAEAKVDVFWDLTKAKYGGGGGGTPPLGPEPLQGFYVTVVSAEDGKVLLHLGDDDDDDDDDEDEAAGNGDTSERLVCRKEHVCGRGFYTTKAKLFKQGGSQHAISIQCLPGDGLHCLRIWIEKELVLQVRHLVWKFRGNHTISVDGMDVELLWDVHDWFFGGHGHGHGIFMFRSFPKQRFVADLDAGSHPFNQKGQLHGFSLLVHAWKQH